jgi:malonyl-CoA O-methyltransferase
LIASSLAFQWFEEPASAIARLAGMLAPGGCLAFTTLVAGTFAEWTAALDAVGLTDVTRRYPRPDALVRQCKPDFHSEMVTYTLTEQHDSGMAFLRALRAIGAATSWDRTASPAALRRAIERFEQDGASVRYEIAEILIRRKHG